ncbi:hypothetical protein JL722_8460 [Aureococcus anophagefferens]|nr:hypothetical protein JL722_8460 [Aureococcus anophagefferens]
MAMGAPGDANVRVLALEENVLVQRGARLTGAASDENFGESTSLSASGDIVAVGAYWADGGWRAGRVQVFQWAGAEWKQLGQDIEGAADGDESGRSIALSADGTALAVGAYYNDGGGYWAGHVPVFALIRDEWIQRGADIEGEAERDRSGSAVSLSGDGSVLAVGAYYNDGGGDYSGHARVFAWVEDSTWEQLGSDIDGEAAGDRLGEAVALSTDGKVLALGAERNHGGGTHNGHVRVFTYDGDDWKQRGSDINGEQAYDSMGWSVSLSADGAILAIGSPRNRYVKVFEFVDDEWTQRGADIVTPSEHDDFGHAVALSSDGSTVAVGAPYATVRPISDGGPGRAGAAAFQAPPRARFQTPPHTRPSTLLRATLEAPSSTSTLRPDIAECLGNEPEGLFDESEKIEAAPFPLSESELIGLAKAYIASFTNGDGVDWYARDFRFVAPVVGPFDKDLFVDSLSGFDLQKAFPI